MKTKYIRLMMLTLLFLLASCSSGSTADWSYHFVVWENHIYALEEQGEIEEDQLEKEIGEVKKYSDKEGIYGNNFSNKYPKGSKLFKIINVQTESAIAVVDSEGKIYQLDNKGEYGK